MRKRTSALTVFAAAWALSCTGCLFHFGETPHVIATNVELSEGNYEIVETHVVGGSTGIKVFGLGTAATYAAAMEGLRGKAALGRGAPRALINITEDRNTIWWLGPLIVTTSIEFTADVIQFKE
jgi:Family of unknown function (DUF6567)